VKPSVALDRAASAGAETPALPDVPADDCFALVDRLKPTSALATIERLAVPPSRVRLMSAYAPASSSSSSSASSTSASATTRSRTAMAAIASRRAGERLAISG
jgi:hypothetical protein